MNRRLPLIILLIMVMSLHAGVLHAGDAAKVVLKLATLAPKGSTMMNILEEMRKEIRRVTEGEVDFKIYGGGVQGDENDVLRKIRFKQLHGGFFTGHGLGALVPEVRVTGIPYVFRNYAEVAYVRNALKDQMNRAFEEKGFVVLGWYDIGFVYSFSKVPITSVEVAREQKFWIWEGDPLGAAVYKVLGIKPVALSFTDVMTSLSTKLIDAAATTPYGAVAFRWYTRFKFMSEYPVTNIVGATIVDKSVWDRISPPGRKKILELSGKYYTRIQQAGHKANEKSIDVLKKAGISIVHVDDAVYKNFIEDIARKTVQELSGKEFSKALIKQTMTLLREYREKHPDSEVSRIQ